MVEKCSEACQLGKAPVCSLCKCCINCCNKCTCSYANTGEDASLAKHLMPNISVEYLWEKFLHYVPKCCFTFLSFPHPGQWRPPLTRGLLLRMRRMQRRKGGMTMQCVLCLFRSRMRRKLMLNLTARILMRFLSFTNLMKLSSAETEQSHLSQTPTLDIGYVKCIASFMPSISL